MDNFTKETVKDTLYMNLDKCIVLEPMKMVALKCILGAPYTSSQISTLAAAAAVACTICKGIIHMRNANRWVHELILYSIVSATLDCQFLELERSRFGKIAILFFERL